VDTCVWRAPTDNDKGGGPFSYFERWRTAGLNSLHRCGEGEGEEHVKLPTALSGTRKSLDGSLTMTCNWNLIPDKKIYSQTIVKCSIVYTFLPDGGIHINSSFSPPSNLPPLPRAGLRFGVADRFDMVEWFGLGPHEAYDDRKFSAYMGVFENTVEGLHEPYVVPQDNGRRADPRWITLKDKNQGEDVSGIMIISDAVPSKRDVEGTYIHAYIYVYMHIYIDIYIYIFI
jgi:beta-galactosidase